ncbi:YbaN family protein [Peribacillus simplex]|uniref:Inner membrane protein YbaN n=1 Tax=Peribacillus simplex TaxID=1478 RepID=A0A9W4KS85_9BACI|nr:YbaN family protein [Peribacillus simplex]WHX90447.1 YbaN family protein [Peribacillus simplex]CAH0158046.1 Inner membrane protein YbaN [Peribacillus simplex]
MITIKKVKSILFFLLGSISLLIGIAGTVLPVLPGGPFYLFAAFCFAKSSKSIENWFKSTSLYEKYVVAFLQKKGMSRKEKIRINLIADFFIVISIFYVDILLVKILLIVLALYKHYYFIKKIKTIDPNNTKQRAF